MRMHTYDNPLPFSRASLSSVLLSIEAAGVFSVQPQQSLPTNVMPQQMHDVAVESSTSDQQQLRSPRRISPSRGSSADPIDLSSPARTSRQQERTRPYPLGRPGRARLTEDERRLCGDYSLPADAVSIPDPRSWFQPTRTLTADTAVMKPKPAANSSFQPLNTLNDATSPPKRSRQTTYGRRDRMLKPTIGQEQYSGQKAYSEQRKRQGSITSYHGFTSPDEHPSKRRKTDQIIDLAGSEDEDGLMRSSNKACRTMSPQSSPHFSRSLQSNVNPGSTSVYLDLEPPAKPVSEFQEVEDQLNPRRAKSRKVDSKLKQNHQSQSSWEGGKLAGSLMTSFDSPSIPAARVGIRELTESAREHILKGFSQGQGSSPPKDQTSPNRYPRARINESIDASAPTRKSRKRVSPLLRERNQTIPNKMNAFESSDQEDELAITDTEKKPHIRSKILPSKNSITDTAARKARDPVASRQGWPLKFARTHGITRNDPKLKLKPDDERIYIVFTQDAEGNFRRLFAIALDKVNKATLDAAGRVRLSGGRRPEGGIHTFDLHFTNIADFTQFKDAFVQLACSSRAITVKDEPHMEALFSNDLTGMRTIDSLPETSSSAQTENLKSGQAGPTALEKIPLARRMKGFDENRDDKPMGTIESNGTSSLEAIVSHTATRPLRSKTNRVLFDAEPPDYQPPVFKYSQEKGLGKRWSKPLAYGEGRRRGDVQFDDLQRLDEEEYLNDNLIEFYMDYLFTKYTVNPDRVFCWNTYFYTALTSKTGGKPINYDAVSRWTSKMDIFAYDYIVVPINDQQHWYLAIICNVSRISRTPILEIFQDHEDETLQKELEESVRDRVPPENKQNSIMGSLEVENGSIAMTGQSDEPRQNREDHINLFDEEAKLSLVDKDDPGGQDTASTDELGEVNLPLDQHAATSAQVEAGANGDLNVQSRLTKSPQKRKAQRKHALAKRNPSEPVVIVLDSLSLPRSKCVRALKAWLKAEGEAKRGMDAIIKENGFYPKESQIPTQSNWSDCGVYVLGYVEKFFQDPDAFKTKLLTGEMSSQQDWPELQPKEMRNNMRDIIQKAALEQETVRQEAKKAKKRALRMNSAPPVAEEPKALDNDSNSSKPADGVHSRVKRLGPGLTEQSSTPQGFADSSKLQSPFQSPQTAPRDSLLPRAPSYEHASDPDMDAKSEEKDTSSRLSPKQETHKRKSPEVRISVKAPQMASSTNKERQKRVETTCGEEISDGHFLTVRGKRGTRHEDEKDDELNAKKKRTITTDKNEHVRQNPSTKSKDVAKDQRGSAASQLIEILDSQEQRDAAVPSPKVATQPLASDPGHVGNSHQLENKADGAIQESRKRRRSSDSIAHERSCFTNNGGQLEADCMEVFVEEVVHMAIDEPGLEEGGGEGREPGRRFSDMGDEKDTRGCVSL